MGLYSVQKLVLLQVALLSSGQLLDCVEVRFGLRRVSTSGRDILLNGQSLKTLDSNACVGL